ncbi:MAG: hypothetical protein ACR2HD_05160 [Solirubrobacteraceae bacterium]|nr:MAG: hypothetical protein DLM63_09035 [Solirubrobacterales bacterium]
MDPRPSESPAVRRRVTLPSGRSIEVLRLEDPQTADNGVDVCPGCGRDLVQPVDWAQAGRDEWRVDLYCPNCDWNEQAVVPTAALERLDQALDAGTDVLRTDLLRLTQANMEEYIERFARALRKDHITPMDF